MTSFPEADLLRLQLEGGVRVQVRPSGTEPKVKLYGEAIDADPTPYLDALDPPPRRADGFDEESPASAGTESSSEPRRFPPASGGRTHLEEVITSATALDVLGRQFWVADVGQLVAAGLSPRTIARARRSGVLVGVLPGVVRLAGAPETFRSRAMALQLHAGEPSFLSGPTAGRLLGLRGMPKRPIQITVPETRRVVVPSWARHVHTSWIDPELDIVERPDGLRVAAPLRMLFGLAGQFSQRFLERAAEDAWHRGLVRPDDASVYLAAVRRSGRGGVARFEAWLRAGRGQPPPEPERIRARRARRHPPRPASPSPPASTSWRCRRARSSTSTWPGPTYPARRRARPLVVARRRPGTAPRPGP